MTESKIKKEYLNFLHAEENVGATKGRKQCKEVILVSDSKGSYISSNIKSADNIKIHIVYKSGGKIGNEYLRRNVFRLARTSVAPVFFIWLGTSEFTIKEARNLYINENTSVNVDLVVRKYESFKREILSINNKAAVLFIECPPVSCSRWNVFQGIPGSSVGTDNTDDRLL